MSYTAQGGTRTSEAFHAVADPVTSATVSQPPRAEPPPPELGIASRVVDDTIVVTVTGEIDTDAAPELQAAVITAIDDAPGGACVLDLTTVDFLDSAGLATLVAAHTHAETRRKHLRIAVDSNSPVIRPIEVTGLDVMLRLYHTVEEALHVTKSPLD
ncbi:STAS domain-containing protein [Amycolatopsis sp. NPDC051071]|uniref:STAS domain-containing protein n=1 Tax=Amycolatopsis sp. NPDC051071 TaxID=3154637 RepID=UPI003412A75D